MNHIDHQILQAHNQNTNKRTSTCVPELVAMTIAEFCQRYGIGRTSAYYELKAGRLKAKKCGRKTLILQASAIEWLNSLSDYSPAT